MTINVIHHPVKSLLWISDLHFEKCSDKERKKFLNQLNATSFDALLITGDISTSHQIERDLSEIAVACEGRPVMFVLGNHDFFGASFADVEKIVVRVCLRFLNLVALGHGEIIQLSKTTAILGHGGWFDGIAGAGQRTSVVSPDRYQIKDFDKLNRRQFFERLETLGRESASYFRQVLPRALSRFENVLIATHVPTFTQVLRFEDRFCDWDKQPFFSNRAAGNVIWGIAKKSSNRCITVYAGHSHSPVSVQMAHNLAIHVSAARNRQTQVGQLLTIR
jgi:predicted phosphodiesterase